MNPSIDLPVGDRPNWEVARAGGYQLKSVADRFIQQPNDPAIIASMEKWLSMFTKFSGKPRGKSTDPALPHHDFHPRGKVELEIGVHILENTTIYEVHYTAPIPNITPQSSSASATHAWRSTAPYSYYQPYSQYTTVYSPPVAAQSQAQVTSDIDTSLNPQIFPENPTSSGVPPTLIDQVNAAAATNPILANLLVVAASKRASPEQIRTLTLLVQSIAHPEPPVPATAEQASIVSASRESFPVPPPIALIPRVTTPAPLAATFSALAPLAQLPPPQPVVPPRPFDLAFEFEHSPTDKWLFPRSPAYCRRIPGANFDFYNIEMVVRMPFGTDEDLDAKGERPKLHKVTIYFNTATPAIWEMLVNWCGGQDKMDEYRRTLDLIVPEDVYLGHRIADGTLMTQLHTVNNPSTKALKPGAWAMRNHKRKAAVAAQKKAANAVGEADGSTEIATAGPSSSVNTTEPATKRARTRVKTGSTVMVIQCEQCKKTNVPLMMGGRFCRACADVEFVVPTINTPGQAVLSVEICSQEPARSTGETSVKQEAGAGQEHVAP